MLDRVSSALYCEFVGCCWPQNQILRCNVELGNEVTQVHHEWAEVLDHPLRAEIEGCKISTHAMVLDEIGQDEDGKPIEVVYAIEGSPSIVQPSAVFASAHL